MYFVFLCLNLPLLTKGSSENPMSNVAGLWTVLHDPIVSHSLIYKHAVTSNRRWQILTLER
jgi:hypothetical protein